MDFVILDYVDGGCQLLFIALRMCQQGRVNSWGVA